MNPPREFQRRPRAPRPKRTRPARGRLGRAHRRAQLHHRLVKIPRSRRADEPIRARANRLCGVRARLRRVPAPRHRREPGAHPDDVTVHRRHRLVERDGRDGGGGVRTDARNAASAFRVVRRRRSTPRVSRRRGETPRVGSTPRCPRLVHLSRASTREGGRVRPPFRPKGASTAPRVRSCATAAHTPLTSLNTPHAYWSRGMSAGAPRSSHPAQYPWVRIRRLAGPAEEGRGGIGSCASTE